MSLSGHRVHAAHAAPQLGRGENIRRVALLQLVVADVLDDRRRLLLVDETRGAQDELLRIHAEEVKCRGIDPRQNGGNRVPRQPRIRGEFAYEIVAHGLRRAFSISGDDLLTHRISLREARAIREL